MTGPSLMDALNELPFDSLFEDRADESPMSSSSIDPGEEEGNANAPIPGGGPLLEEADPSKLFKLIDDEVVEQEPLAKNRDQAGKHWDRVRRGIPFCYLEKSEDSAVWRATLAPGIEDVEQPIPNKVLDLCNKQVSQILVDPPLPNPKPDGAAEKNRSAMDLAKRFLRADGDASGTNDMELFRKALTTNRTRASAFAYVWVDPTGGGWRPMQKQAHPQATDANNPLQGPMLDGNGQPIVGANGNALTEPTADPILRYVGEVTDEQTGEPSGQYQFVDSASQAAREWLPKHRATVLPPNQVRLLPPTAELHEAHGLVLLLWAPLSEVRRRFPDAINGLSDTELRAIAEWRPRRWKSIVPPTLRPRTAYDRNGKINENTLIFWYHRFCVVSPDYPDGAEIAVNGGRARGGESEGGAGFVFLRDTLREDVETENGDTVPVLMDPPVAQFRALFDTDDGDPMGVAPVSSYGGANQTRAHLYVAILEDIDLRVHMNTYLTGTSGVTKDDINRRDGTPIDVLSKDDMPIFEQRPPLPAAIEQMLDRVDHDLDTLANLNQTAQALDSAYSESGEAKKVAIRQAKVQLAQEFQGFINGCTQYWKIKLQLAQAKLKVPQLVKLAGEDSAYKARHFVGADLFGISTVALQPGSGTMMSPGEKAQYLAQFQNMQWLEADEAGEVARTSMADDLGLPPNPHEEHIDRCVADWMEGPPPGWQERYDAVQAFPQQQQEYAATLNQTVAALVSSGLDQQTATAQAQQQSPPPQQPPDPGTPFEPRANDEEMSVAKVHYAKLSKLMATTEFSKQPVSWQSCVSKRYAQAVYAAGVTTVRDQQQAQQAAAGQKPDPNAPPTYQQFLATVNQKVISMAEQLFAREIAALGEAKDVAEKPLPVPVPETIGPDPTHPLDLAHQTMENERDRQHELQMAGAKHDQAMQAKQHDTNAQLLGRALDHAHEKAIHASGAPRPERAGPDNPDPQPI